MEKLKIGHKGSHVKRLQLLLNTWMLPPYNYLFRPALPRLREDGSFGPITQERLRGFQKYRFIPQTGEADYPTILMLHPWTTLKLDLEYKVPRLSDRPLFEPVPPLRKSGKFDLNLEFTDSWGMEKNVVVSKDSKTEDKNWEFKRTLEAEIKIASIGLLKPAELTVSGAFTPVGSGIEAKAKLKWEDLWEIGPVHLSPYSSFSAESDAFRNFAIKPSLGAELKLDLFTLKNGSKGSLELDGGFGVRKFLLQDTDDHKPTWSVPFEGSALFKIEFGGAGKKK